MAYSTPIDPTTATPSLIACTLRASIARAARQLATIAPKEAVQPRAVGKWSAQQTIGHLIDSCSNNLQRFVRLQLTDTLTFPGYPQDDCVRIQRFELEPWPEIVSLFLALNRHFAHTIEHGDPATLQHVWLFEGVRLPLSFILADYIGHLEHHLLQLPNYSLTR